MTKERVILIDTDTASDDAVALIMALRSPGVQVAAITVVAGNVGVEQGTQNALFAVELCESDVPVYRGMAKPLQRKLETADWFHGADGLGDHGYGPKFRRPERMHGVDAIIATVQANPGIEIITLGPLTNLAMAITREPGIITQISRCVIMGGAPCCEGNVTPAAEFNIWVDPEAAAMVFRSRLPIELIGWQLSRYDAVVQAGEIAAIEALGTSWAEFAIRSNSTASAAYLTQTGETGISLPDPIAMAVLLQPSLSLQSSRHFIAVETSSVLARGMTVVDRLDVARDPRNVADWSDTLTQANPIAVCWQLDVAGWKAMLLRSLQKSSSPL